MQHLILTIVLVFSVIFMSNAQEVTENNSENTITVTVPNVLNNNGKINFALFTQENFRKQPLFAKSSSIENGKSIVTFEKVPTGTYAIICFHDENNNDQMDFQENGMPKESYGTSNNPMNFGPPQFDSSKFQVADKDISLEIKF
ncbi:MAG: DUF2141 domain-containing protein [Lutibacter sp.]|uniref:DUF2141 domain-containing protein n=1 Tax=Lutibacter sp. TaxID=1925666 RepID=UPI0017A3C694|nr:DUF2141 domain-containing protein [Lutibacter sp.]MBT8317020.1 DUF2141 domain-containing protein [Lutibacter sp.]NNJ57880.1 DUF2141 domain-containing protein [Lutibacter sp.]